MFEIREKPKACEKALLIGVLFDKREEDEAASLLDELRELVETLGIPIAESLLVYARESNARYLTGQGKATELMQKAKDLGCDVIIFDNSLAPMQQRAWESEGGITVIDREEVILDIFAMRARTAEARLQVELARQQYALPRLARMWGHLGACACYLHVHVTWELALLATVSRNPLIKSHRDGAGRRAFAPREPRAIKTCAASG